MDKIFILVLILTAFALTKAEKELITLTDSNFDKIIPYNYPTESKWFVLFGVPSCAYCKQVHKVLKEQVIVDERANNYNFAAIDCNQNIWSAMRFNITKIPYIVMIQGEYMYEFRSPAQKDVIFDFLAEEKNVEDRKRVPKPVGMMKMFIKVLSVILSNMDDQMQILLQKYHIDIVWQRAYSIILIILGLVLITIIESKLVELCFGRRKNQKVNEKNKDEKKDKEEEKKDEKKDEKSAKEPEKEEKKETKEEKNGKNKKKKID